MSLPVFVTEGVRGARTGDRVLLDGDEGRHAATVKRIRVGEQVVLTDGDGTRLTGSVVEATKSTLVVEAAEVEVVPAATPHVTVVQAIPKGDRGELAVEVLTEIDVDTIVPWAASRSVAVWRGERAAKSLAKWRSAAQAAAKQARRARFPEVTTMATTAEVADLLAAADLAVVLHEAATDAFADLDLAGVGSVVVVVGPEGGISDDELAAFGSARTVRLGASVLRTSTAGVAAVAALLSRTPRWR
ncbi:16S rRNA (uracil(1498)-N(3))-methyltransferase [Marmoricola sp. RAF53]|uniref:16S rRNA (uracil(1498)-N(3))-methyltransferase n=1 Tax=Marmoricola sp. RAF53 TaxID=3233059 RepID=UPI003F94893C